MPDRSLLTALQKAQLDALELLRAELSHHALCWRSINMMPHYSELVTETIRPSLDGMTQDEKQDLFRGIEWILVNLEAAEIEISSEFRLVTRRTVIIFADIAEGLFESTLGICLFHLDPDKTSIRDVTSFKQQATSERKLKKAVRAWESSLFDRHPLRTNRMTQMIKTFFPDFMPPDTFPTLDRLFADRNRFTHELIRFSDQSDEKVDDWTLVDVDKGFGAASDFLLALMTAIPGDLRTPLAPR